MAANSSHASGWGTMDGLDGMTLTTGPVDYRTKTMGLKQFWATCYIIHICLILLANFGLISLILFSPSHCRPLRKSSSTTTSRRWNGYRKVSYATIEIYQYIRRLSGSGRGSGRQNVASNTKSRLSRTSECSGTAGGIRRGIKKSRINLLIAWLSFSDVVIAAICLPIYVHFEFFHSPSEKTAGEDKPYMAVNGSSSTLNTLNSYLGTRQTVANNMTLENVYGQVSQESKMESQSPTCKTMIVFYFFNDFAGFSNVLTTIFIAVDRFRAISGSMKYRQKAMAPTKFSKNRYTRFSMAHKREKALIFKSVWNMMIKIILSMIPEIIILAMSFGLAMPIITILYNNRCKISRDQEKWYLIFHTIIGAIIPLLTTAGLYLGMIHILKTHKFVTKPVVPSSTPAPGRNIPSPGATKGGDEVKEEVDETNAVNSLEMSSIRTQSNASETQGLTQNLGCHPDAKMPKESQKCSKADDTSTSTNTVVYVKPLKSRKNELKAIRMAMSLILLQTFLSAPLIAFQTLEISGTISVSVTDRHDTELIDIIKNAMNIFGLTDRWLNVLLIFMFCKNFRSELKYQVDNFLSYYSLRSVDRV